MIVRSIMSNPKATVGSANLIAFKLKQIRWDSMFSDQQAVKAGCSLVGANESDQAGGQAQRDCGRKPRGEIPDWSRQTKQKEWVTRLVCWWHGGGRGGGGDYIWFRIEMKWIPPKIMLNVKCRNNKCYTRESYSTKQDVLRPFGRYTYRNYHQLLTRCQSTNALNSYFIIKMLLRWEETKRNNGIRDKKISPPKFSIVCF